MQCFVLFHVGDAIVIKDSNFYWDKEVGNCLHEYEF